MYVQDELSGLVFPTNPKYLRPRRQCRGRMGKDCSAIAPALLYYSTSMYLSRQSYCISSVHGGQAHECMDAGGRATQEAKAEERRSKLFL